jgi:hypothetical protein
MLWPLLQRFAGEKKGWRDVIGTRYDFSDLYGVILDAEENLKPEDRKWKICVKSAAPNWPNGPFLWPERYGYSALKAIENDPTQGPAVLASQYLMNPIPAKSGLITSEDQIVWLPRKVIDELYAFLRLRVTIDVADLDPATLKGSDTDYTVLNLHGFGHDGTLYILEVNQGRFDGQEVINLIFDLYKRHPRIIEFKIEEEAHSRVLGPFLYREQARKNIWLPITKIKRDNQTSKQQRIRGLQPLFIAKRIKFAEDLTCKTNLNSKSCASRNTSKTTFWTPVQMRCITLMAHSYQIYCLQRMPEAHEQGIQTTGISGLTTTHRPRDSTRSCK